MFKNIFTLLLSLGFINLHLAVVAAGENVYSDIVSSNKLKILENAYTDINALDYSVLFTRINTSYLISIMQQASKICNSKILIDFIAKQFPASKKLELKDIHIINYIILALINNQCLDKDNCILSALLNLNFNYAILANLPKEWNFIILYIAFLHPSILQLNKSDWYLLLKYLFNSLRNNLADDFEYVKQQLSLVMDYNSGVEDVIKANEDQINAIVSEIKSSMKQLDQSNFDSIRGLVIINSIDKANKVSKKTFITLIAFYECYLYHLDQNILSEKCANIIIQILQDNDFQDYCPGFNKQVWIDFFDVHFPYLQYPTKSIEILNKVYSEQWLEDVSAVKYELDAEKLAEINKYIFSEVVDQVAKDDLVKDIVENKHNKNFYGLLLYIKYANDNKEKFENKLSSEQLLMILAYLESNAFANLPLLSQKEWTILVKKIHIESVRAEQSFCCIA